MGTRRLGLALLLLYLFQSVITSIFYVRVTRAQAPPAPPTRHVIAAAVALQPGVPLTADNLTEINWPANVPLEGLIEKKEDAIGRISDLCPGAEEPGAEDMAGVQRKLRAVRQDS